MEQLETGAEAKKRDPKAIIQRRITSIETPSTQLEPSRDDSIHLLTCHVVPAPGAIPSAMVPGTAILNRAQCSRLQPEPHLTATAILCHAFLWYQSRTLSRILCLFRICWAQRVFQVCRSCLQGACRSHAMRPVRCLHANSEFLVHRCPLTLAGLDLAGCVRPQEYALGM